MEAGTSFIRVKRASLTFLGTEDNKDHRESKFGRVATLVVRSSWGKARTWVKTLGVDHRSVQKEREMTKWKGAVICCYVGCIL